MDKIVSGKKGKLTLLIVVFGVVMVASLTWLLIPDSSAPSNSTVPSFFGFASIVVGISVGAWLAFANLAERTEVSLDKVVIRGPFGSHESLFRHVRSVEVLPLYGNTLFFGYNIVVLADLSQPGAKNHAINASIFANRHEIVKAVIEAAYRSNPEVRIDRSLLRSYGRPPYGIFGSTEVDA